jgi:two-component system CheB/CheR fusion protein
MNADEEDGGFEKLLAYLRQNRGFDFTGYKRPSLVRRVERRMHSLGMGGFADYVDYLEVHPDEFGQLFNAILINVTSFFRDAPAWDYVRQEIVPSILRGKAASEPLRIWSAGCASGEEAYTAAMLFAEAMGPAEFKERVKIYATDVDEHALNQARQASYDAKALESLDPALRERYFEAVNGRYLFRGDLRRTVIFGRHDIVQDAPISHVDFLTCRNTIMYFNAEAQARVLEKFYFALNQRETDGGYLLLGRAEMLLTHGDLFTPVDLKHRVFRKVPAPGPRPRDSALTEKDVPMPRNRLSEQALEESPVPRLVIDANGILTLANLRARVLFTIGERDVGRPLKDLEVSYRPADLRSLIEQAYALKHTVTRTSVERRFPEGGSQFFDIVIAPVLNAAGEPLGCGITFVEITDLLTLQQELKVTREEVQTASEELQTSNEELETTNEELQSSNEELETTNEELQSTNEELETMNEELQSTNEELQTVNEELRQRTDEINQLNAFFESVLAGLGSGAIVVNRNLDVLMWNKRSQELWGLRADEVQGKSFLNLDIGLPVAELRAPIRACLAGESEQLELKLDATNRRGKPVRLHVTCTPLRTGRSDRDGAILLMEEAG